MISFDESAERARDAFVYLAVSNGKFYVNIKPVGLMSQYVSGPHDTAEEAQESLAALRAAEQPAPENGEDFRMRIYPDGETVAGQRQPSPADAGSGEDADVAWLRWFADGSTVYGAHLRDIADKITRLSSCLSAAREQIAAYEAISEATRASSENYEREFNKVAADRDALSREVERLREALQPFAEVFDRYPITTDDSHGIMFSFRDLRRAASLARGE